MEMNNRAGWYLRVQNVIFVVLVIAILGTAGWLGERYEVAFDWTANQRNSLSEDSAALLESLDAPLEITAYVSEDEVLRTGISNLLQRYQRVKPDLAFRFVNPDLAPEQARDAGVRFDGTLVLNYRGRREQVSNLSESTVSEAIARLSRERETWAVFSTGHGERAPTGRANFDFALLARELEQQGFRLQSLNLATAMLPENTGIVVIAGPRNAWLPAEVAQLRAYLEKGGNVLWLTDPEGAPLPELSAMLGVNVKPGTVVDATTQMLGVTDPTVAVVGEYPATGPVANFNVMTLYPGAAVLAAHEAANWTAIPILRTTPNSWRETGQLVGNVELDEGDEAGPLVIGLALERKRSDGGTQRAVVIGDGDFASNAFIGNQGNLALASNLFNWLGQQDALLNIRIKDAPDAVLHLGSTAQIVIALCFLLVLPAALLGTGLFVFVRRRRR